jgi:hypothetical protein
VDPEAMRNALERYFDAMRAIVEGHGGTVEKFVGDAVLAVFGIPNVHEDDALRAVNAAVAMRDELARLRPELGVELHARIGINTGEVVTGEGDTFATGDTMNVAARLEQWAEPGEILIGASTQELVSSAVRVEELDPLPLKGKAEPVTAFRLLEMLARDRDGRPLMGPFVGRKPELQRLLDEFARTVGEKRCHLVSVTGDAGIGKSRLVRELATRVEGEARLLIGRCLSYGEGITYWPLRDVVFQLAGPEPLPELTRLLRDVTVAETVAGAIGAARSAATRGEIQWSVRRLLETVAAEGPLVLVLDDLHWAEPAFLDLVDYLHDFIRCSPVLLIGTGRPELLDQRPGWRPSALELSPLSDTDAAALVDGLTRGFAAELSTRVIESAEGNPLFLEQFCAMADETGEPTVPPSIQGLLAARIDQLPGEERAVAERGAIEGRLFHRGSVTELSNASARPEVAAQLSSLVRRDLIRPAESLFVGDDGYRFAHALVREAVYSATPKATRAELHEHFAEWLEGAADTHMGELDEIRGYHLEQAHRLRGEVNPPDERTRDLGAKAARLLCAAGRRASNRGDYSAAQNLRERAVATDPHDDPAHPRYLLDLAETTSQTRDMAAAIALAEQARTEALEKGDDADEARAELLLADLRGQRGELNAAELRAAADRALDSLPLEDDHWLARAWQAKAAAANYDGGASTIATYELTERFSREALRLARKDGDGPVAVLAITYQAWSRVLGATPVADAMATCEELRASTETKLAKASVDGAYGYLLALTGQTAAGRRLAEDSRRFFQEAGDAMSYAGTAFFEAELQIWDEDLDAAERTLNEASRILEEMDEAGYRSTVIVYLAYIQMLRGDFEQAESLALKGRSLGGDDDIANEIWSRRVLAPVHAARGELDAAERLAREAVDLADSNSPLAQGEARLVLARILRQSGREAESRAAATEAVRIYEQKGAKLLLPEALALAEAPIAS